MPLFQQPFMSGGFPSMNRAAGAIGGWVELGRTTLGSNTDPITVSSLADKRYYMILTDINSYTSGVNADCNFRLNNDSGSNYADRRAIDGSEGTQTSQTQNDVVTIGNDLDYFSVGYLANRSANEKLGYLHACDNGTLGAGTAPRRTELAHKWANTSNPFSRIDWVCDTSSGTYASGSECVVLGWDEADTHTNNFWEELASVELGSAASSIDSGTFTAKKYLWVQLWKKGSGTANDQHLRFNGDTGTNYSSRQSVNGAADGTVTSSAIAFGRPVYSHGDEGFFNCFIINNTSNEKLGIWHHIIPETAGAGTAPVRSEGVSKWANTSNQITQIECIDAGGGNDFGIGTIIKVWGAD